MLDGTASVGTGMARRPRSLTRRPCLYGLVALGAAAVIALAACGGSSDSSSSKKSTTSTTKKSTATTAKGGSATAVVKTASTPLGTIVVTNDGKTVYTLTSGGQQVPCSGACLQVWPAVTSPAGTTKATGTGVENVGTAAGGHVTINGAPVYTFAGDAGAGTTNGEGINSFGGTWNVVKASGGTSGGGGSTATTTATTTMGSGSGY
jgi:predicted lipoprotein with Yx(FWY)xxD motif